MGLMQKLKDASLFTFGRYMRANLIILIMTTVELTVGFLIIGVRYALLIAVVTALIDILPVFGSGAVLIPYAVISFVRGDFALGIKLVVLYAVVSFVRQISEPRIMGKSLGVHPLLSLMAVYIGYRFFGVIGMVFMPLLIVMIKNISEKKEASA